MKRTLLIMTMLSCICIAIANVDRPVRMEIDGARGQPEMVVGMNVEMVVPGVIETNRKERDVDSWRYSNVILNTATSIENITANAEPDKVRWRSWKGNIKGTKNIAKNIHASTGNRVRWLC